MLPDSYNQVNQHFDVELYSYVRFFADLALFYLFRPNIPKHLKFRSQDCLSLLSFTVNL